MLFFQKNSTPLELRVKNRFAKKKKKVEENDCQIIKDGPLWEKKQAPDVILTGTVDAV